MGEYKAMHIDVVLHHRLQDVKRILQRRGRQGLEEFLAAIDVGNATGIANGDVAVFDGGFFGCVHCSQRFFVCSAVLLDLPRVSIKDLEDGKRPPFGWQQVDHLPRWQHRHCGVKADIVFAAKSLGIG